MKDDCDEEEDSCIGCLVVMTYLDRAPNGDRSATCARCKAEENHDFDAEPDAKFSRSGERL